MFRAIFIGVLAVGCCGLNAAAKDDLFDDDTKPKKPAAAPTEVQQFLDKALASQFVLWWEGVDALEASYACEDGAKKLGVLTCKWKRGDRGVIPTFVPEPGIEKGMGALLGVALASAWHGSLLMPIPTDGAKCKMEKQDETVTITFGRGDGSSEEWLFTADAQLLRCTVRDKDKKPTMSLSYKITKAESDGRCYTKSVINRGLTENSFETDCTLSYTRRDEVPVLKTIEGITVLKTGEKRDAFKCTYTLVDAKFTKGAKQRPNEAAKGTETARDNPRDPTPEEAICEDKRLLGTWRGSFPLQGVIYTEEITYSEDGRVRSLLTTDRGVIVWNQRGTFTYRDGIIDIKYPTRKTTPSKLRIVDKDNLIVTVEEAQLRYRRVP